MEIIIGKITIGVDGDYDDNYNYDYLKLNQAGLLIGDRLDLYKDTDVTVDYTIFPISNVTERTVSYTNEFTIPKTDWNKSLIDPIINSTAKFDVLLLGDGISMNGTMYVESSNINIIGEDYSVMVVDKMKEKLDKLNDGLDSIVDDVTDKFLWLFNTKDVIRDIAPFDTSADSFFLSTCNFNGIKYKEFTDNYPVYVQKYLTDITQMLWSWRYDTFINKCMDYAGIDFKTLGSYSAVTDDINFGELSVNVNAPFKSDDNRDMKFDIQEDGRIDGMQIDYCKQIEFGLAGGELYGMTDTRYSSTASGLIKLKTLIECDPYAPNCECDTLSAWWGGENDGFEYGIVIEKEGAEISRYSVGTFPDMTGNSWACIGVGKKDMDRTRPLPSVTEFELDLLAAQKIAFRYALFFKRDCTLFRSNGSASLTYRHFKEGVYFIDIIDTYLDTDYSTEVSLFDKYDSFYPTIEPETSITFDYTTVDNINPCVEMLGLLDTDVDANTSTILPELSMQQTDYTMSSIINDILDRYNLGVWESSDNKTHISRFNDRYKGYIDLSYKLLDEETLIDFSNDVIKTFEYKNSSNGNDVTSLKSTDGTKFTLGDVLKYDVNNGGDIDESITLNSFPASREIYGGNNEVGYPQEMLDRYPIEQLGASYNEQIHISDTGISHGFFKLNSEDIRQAYVDSVNYTDGLDTINRVEVQYRLNGGRWFSLIESNQYPEISAEKDGKSILLGNTNGEIESNSVARNFKFDNGVPDFKQTYSISTYLTDEEINNIRDGNIILIADEEYLPIKLSGVSFNSDGGSYVTITSVKKDTTVPPFPNGDFNQDFNNDTNNN